MLQSRKLPAGLDEGFVSEEDEVYEKARASRIMKKVPTTTCMGCFYNLCVSIVQVSKFLKKALALPRTIGSGLPFSAVVFHHRFPHNLRKT